MTNKFLNPAGISAFIFLAALTVSGQDFCSEIRKWKGPRPIFSKFDDKEDLLVIANERKPVNKESVKRGNGSETFYFVTNEQENEVIVFTGKDYNLKITVPDFRHRPLEAKWVNPKLLFVQISFNPRYGAYWILDVEEEKVVFKELQNDGLDAWEQCRKEKVKP